MSGGKVIKKGFKAGLKRGWWSLGWTAGVLGGRFGEKKASILWVITELIHTFASPSKNGELAYVSTNQNQIAVVRSQSGG